MIASEKYLRGVHRSFLTRNKRVLVNKLYTELQNQHRAVGSVLIGGYDSFVMREAHKQNIINVLNNGLSIIVKDYSKIAKSFYDDRTGKKALTSENASIYLDILSEVERLAKLEQQPDFEQQAEYIATTTFDNIEEVIQQGIDDGLSSEQIALLLLAFGRSRNASRANTITNTITNGIANNVSLTMAEQLSVAIGGFVKKKWLNVDDAVTRPWHASMKFKPAIPLDQKFIVDGEFMNRPRDPSASAKNTVNCRCSMTYIITN